MHAFIDSSGKPVFTRVQLRQGTGLVYTQRRGKRKQRSECSGLFPHTYDGNQCGACRKRTVTHRFWKFVETFLEWVELKFGDR